jgi:hypothetical protein
LSEERDRNDDRTKKSESSEMNTRERMEGDKSMNLVKGKKKGEDM